MILLMLILLANSAGILQAAPSKDAGNSGVKQYRSSLRISGPSFISSFSNDSGSDKSDKSNMDSTTVRSISIDDVVPYTDGWDPYQVGFNKSSISTNVAEEEVNVASGQVKLKIKLTSLPLRGGKTYDVYLTYRGSPLSLDGMRLDVDKYGDEHWNRNPVLINSYGTNNHDFIVAGDMGNCGLGWDITPGEISVAPNAKQDVPMKGHILEYYAGSVRLNGGNNYGIFKFNTYQFWNDYEEAEYEESIRGIWRVSNTKDMLVQFDADDDIADFYTPGYKYHFGEFAKYPQSSRTVESENGEEVVRDRKLFLVTQLTDKNGNYINVEWHDKDVWSSIFPYECPPAERVPKRISTPTDGCTFSRKRIKKLNNGSYQKGWDFYVVDTLKETINGDKFKVVFYYTRTDLSKAIEYWYHREAVLLDSIAFFENDIRIKPSYKFFYDDDTGELVKFITPDGVETEYWYEQDQAESFVISEFYGLDETFTTAFRRISSKQVTIPETGEVLEYEYDYVGEDVDEEVMESSVGFRYNGMYFWYWDYGEGEWVWYPISSWYPLYKGCEVRLPGGDRVSYRYINDQYMLDKFTGHYPYEVVAEILDRDGNVVCEVNVYGARVENFYGKPKYIRTYDAERGLIKTERFFWKINDEIDYHPISKRSLHSVLSYHVVTKDNDDATLNVNDTGWELFEYNEYDKYDNKLEYKYRGNIKFLGTQNLSFYQDHEDIDIDGWPQVFPLPVEEWTNHEGILEFDDLDYEDSWIVEQNFFHESRDEYRMVFTGGVLYRPFLVHLLHGRQEFSIEPGGGVGQKVGEINLDYDGNDLCDVSSPSFHDSDWDQDFTVRGNLTKKIEWRSDDPDDYRSKEYWYDICGNAVEMTNYMGEKYKFKYDDDAVFPEEKIYPNNKSEYVDFDNEGRLTSVTDRSGIINSSQYDIYGRLTESRRGISGDLSLLEEYEYDDFNRMATATAYSSVSSSNTVHHYYDELGRLEKDEFLGESSGTDVIKEYFYDKKGNLNKETLPRFRNASTADTVKKKLDILGSVMEIEYPSASGDEIVTYDYSLNDYGGRETEVTDEEFNITKLLYNPSGDLMEVIDADDNHTDYYYDVNGNLDSIIDAEGKKVSFEYDWLGNLVRREGPDRGVDTFAYYPDGQFYFHVNNSDDSIFYSYDKLGRIKAKGGLGLYDPPMVYILDTLFYDTETQYIVPEYESWTDWELNEDISQWERVVIRFITKCGLPATYKDVLGQCSLYVFFEDPVDTFERYFEIWEGSPDANQWGYLPNSGYSIGFDREDYGNIISGIRMKHTGEGKYEYNFPYGYPGGNWADSIKNVTVEGLGYDSLPYVTVVDKQEEYFYDNYKIKGTTYTPPLGLTYSQGRPTGFENENVREVYFYDKFGNLSYEKVIPSVGASEQKDFQYSYDLKGKLTKSEYPGYKVEYEYDKLGNISSATINDNQTINISSTAAGLLSGIRFPGSVKDTFEYTQRNWMDWMKISDNSSDLYWRDFEYNKRGELLEEFRYAPSPQTTVATYTYDDLGRLTNEDREGTDNDHSFTYDAVGNRDVVDGVAYQYIDQTNKLINDGVRTYEYNDIGCIKSKSDVNGMVNFYYDSKGRLKGLCDEEGNGYKYYYKGMQRIREEELSDIEFEAEGYKYYCKVKYDNLTGGILEAVFLNSNNNEIGDSVLYEIEGSHLNDWEELSGYISYEDCPAGTENLKLRVRRESSSSGTLLVGNMNISIDEGIIGEIEEAYDYFYDIAGNLLMINDKDGNPQTKYIYAGSRLLAKEKDGELYFYHLNQLGSPIVITDESGNVVKQKKYEAFGNLISASGTHEDKREFTGKEKDPTGFHYFGARYYSGNIGRFLSPDPHTLGPGGFDRTDPQTLNPYVYCTNDPLYYFDPDGLVRIDRYNIAYSYGRIMGTWVGFWTNILPDEVNIIKPLFFLGQCAADQQSLSDCFEDADLHGFNNIRALNVFSGISKGISQANLDRVVMGMFGARHPETVIKNGRQLDLNKIKNGTVADAIEEIRGMEAYANKCMYWGGDPIELIQSGEYPWWYDDRFYEQMEIWYPGEWKQPTLPIDYYDVPDNYEYDPYDPAGEGMYTSIIPEPENAISEERAENRKEKPGKMDLFVKLVMELGRNP